MTCCQQNCNEDATKVVRWIDGLDLHLCQRHYVAALHLADRLGFVGAVPATTEPSNGG